MDYLFRKLDAVRGALKGKSVFLCLDYDGTLVPISDTPGKAILSSETRMLLRSLASNRRCQIAVISGRALADVKRRLGLDNIVYSGNHGLEIEGPRLRFKTPVSARYRAALGRIEHELSEKISLVKGVLIENKGLSLAVHFRLVRAKDVPFVKTAFHESVIHYLVSNIIQIRAGKMVLEVRPVSVWDKGKTALWLLARQRFLQGESGIVPVYIGDDLTDEDAFKAFRGLGITVYVGAPGESHARYYLNNTVDVRKFLEMLLEVLEGGIQ